jgi:microcystin-dependent protein
MNKNHVIITLLVILLIGLWFMRNKSENATFTTQSNEAVQNVASVFSDLSGTITVNNLRITGNTIFTQFKGIIVAWSGAIANIPTGWGLCDGTLYTAFDGTKLLSPDLRSTFILGASKPNTRTDEKITGPDGQPKGIGWLTPQQVGTQYGEENHTLNNNEIPQHYHNIQHGGDGDGNITSAVLGADSPLTAWQKSDNGHDPVTTDDLGGKAHNNMPPYYALAYIIKL